MKQILYRGWFYFQIGAVVILFSALITTLITIPILLVVHVSGWCVLIVLTYPWVIALMGAGMSGMSKTRLARWVNENL